MENVQLKFVEELSRKNFDLLLDLFKKYRLADWKPEPQKMISDFLNFFRHVDKISSFIDETNIYWDDSHFKDNDTLTVKRGTFHNQTKKPHGIYAISNRDTDYGYCKQVTDIHTVQNGDFHGLRVLEISEADGRGCQKVLNFFLYDKGKQIAQA